MANPVIALGYWIGLLIAGTAAGWVYIMIGFSLVYFPLYHLHRWRNWRVRKVKDRTIYVYLVVALILLIWLIWLTIEGYNTSLDSMNESTTFDGARFIGYFIASWSIDSMDDWTLNKWPPHATEWLDD
jgi:amino acid transporter